MARIAAALKQGSRARVALPHMIARAIVAVVFLTAAYAGSARAETLASACTQSYQPQTLDVSQPINLGQLKAQIYFYACSGAYDGELTKVLSDAQSYVEKRAGEVSKPCLLYTSD